MILDAILEQKTAEVARRRVERPVSELRDIAADMPAPRDFSSGFGVLPTGVPAVIAEVKKASPSKGLIRADCDPVAIARSYEAAGAAAISVLTDETFFQGSLQYLADVKQAVKLPVLRKDFVIDDYQVIEARAWGSDAVLLIVAALEKRKLIDLMESARGYGMECLIEVHDSQEMGIALECGASLIGINNRNLYTFDTDISTTIELAPMAMGIKLVSESGISTREDLALLGEIGLDAVLIGEALMRAPDAGAKLKELLQ